MGLDDLLRIACRYDTPMADAMIAAVVLKAQATGTVLSRLPRARMREPRERPEIPFSVWRRYVERNSDTRWNHV